MNLAADDLNKIKLYLISIFSQGGTLYHDLINMSAKDVSLVFEFFKLADDLKDVWFSEWLGTIQRWDILFTSTSAILGYVTVAGKHIAIEIESVDTKLLTICTSDEMCIPLAKLPGDPLTESEVHTIETQYNHMFPESASQPPIRLSHMLN